MKIQPVIKWSGSKRSQGEEIIKYFPKEIQIYYEPFVGGASILRQLLESDIDVEKYICSDINSDLINLWNTIKYNPQTLSDKYAEMWQELNYDKNLERKKNYFYNIRKRFNEIHQPEDFLFISRTTTNGLIRYNQKGEFNNSFHITRNGIVPESLHKIIFDWHNALNNKNVQFISCDYQNINTNKNDFMYLDPPYAGTKGMYYGTINYKIFWEWLLKQNCQYALSFDGICGEEDRTYKVPKEIYNDHIYIHSGCSSFKRLKTQTTEYVKESLYLKKIGKIAGRENLLTNKNVEKENFQEWQKNIFQT